LRRFQAKRLHLCATPKSTFYSSVIARPFSAKKGRKKDQMHQQQRGTALGCREGGLLTARVSSLKIGFALRLRMEFRNIACKNVGSVPSQLEKARVRFVCL
jgi:hypothetical protein